LLRNEAEGELAKGEAELKLENEKLYVLPKFGEVIQLSLIDIAEIMPHDYSLEMTLSSREILSVFDLGYKYEDLVLNLFHLRNEIILKYLLMNESAKRSGIWGELTLVDASGKVKQFERCEIRLYETSMVLMPAMGEPIKVLHSNIAQAETKDYTISITTESGEKLNISKLGKEFESTARDLSAAMNQLNLQSQALIKDLVPLADPSIIRAVSRLLKDGKAARRTDIESESPEVWSALEKKLQQTSIWNEYQYLKSIGHQEKIAIGIKRGLMGDLTGNYLWLLIPIYGKDPKFAKAMVMEAVRLPSDLPENQSQEEGMRLEADSNTATGGNATYVFRIVSPKDSTGFTGNEKGLDARVDNMISTINQLMLDINFRREPIFLSDELLRTEPKYAKYRYATQKIQSLKELRHLFMGRIIHSSFEQWKTDIADLLSLNSSTDDDPNREK
jgi:hypothetical protein